MEPAPREVSVGAEKRDGRKKRRGKTSQKEDWHPEKTGESRLTGL